MNSNQSQKNYYSLIIADLKWDCIQSDFRYKTQTSQLADDSSVHDLQKVTQVGQIQRHECKFDCRCTETFTI